nr:sigma-70 family RNA polymerase sigma factor [Lentibacillus saliphilus]
MLDYYKKKKPELLRDENTIETLLVDNYTPEVSATINNELETILGKLSTTEQAIIIAKEIYGYDYQEISQLLNVSVPTIKSTVFRMRKRMIKER